MESPARRPRLVVIVGNGITGDSRVQKTAIAAARDGWDVTLVGVGRNRTMRSRMGPIQVVRVPVGTEMLQKGKGHPARRVFTQFRIADKAALARLRATHQTWVRRTTARIGWIRGAQRRSTGVALLARPAGTALGMLVRVRREVHQLRVRAFGWEQRHQRSPTGDWRKDWPYLLDLDLALGPVIEELKPDVIHANDITMISAVGQSVARMRARGERVSWLYDSHEYIRGIDWPTPLQAKAFPAVEREFIGRADAVVTVSPQLADLLRRDYQLAKLPLVVRNTPIRETVGVADTQPTIREVCGLAPEVPLLVYAGWIAAPRGLATAVDALPHLPECHLALVTGRSGPELDSLLSQADALGVRDRIHVAPYVPQHAVSAYLSSADFGLICFKRTRNHEISLPTKLPEYLHARLPLITSDVQVVREYVEQHGVGEVFRAEDPDSFADAVKRAMAHRPALVEHITDAILDELSWEQQSLGLLRLYRELSAIAPTAARVNVSWAVQEGDFAPGDTGSAHTAARGPLARWRALDSTRVRLGLGPANYAGQAAAFAQAICRDNPDVSAEVVMRKDAATFVFPADVYLDSSGMSDLSLQIEQLARVIGRYTHLIADAFLPIFGNLNGDNIDGDLPALRRAQIQVALLAHGSEVRHPKRHLDRYEFSLFRDAPEGIAQRFTIRAERNRRVAEECGLPLFVTTPDLLDDLPTARWAPLVVDVDEWAHEGQVMRRQRPIVLHGPSQRWTKGTDRILPFLTDLHDRGVIELQLAERVDRTRMVELVKNCDIVLDQFTTGGYGTFAVEAMAAGKPVLAYLSDGVEQVVGVRPPIVNATPATLREAIESLLDDRDRAAQLGAEGVTYVHDHHDGRRTARAFDDFLR